MRSQIYHINCHGILGVFLPVLRVPCVGFVVAVRSHRHRKYCRAKMGESPANGVALQERRIGRYRVEASITHTATTSQMPLPADQKQYCSILSDSSRNLCCLGKHCAFLSLFLSLFL